MNQRQTKDGRNTEDQIDAKRNTANAETEIEVIA